VATFVTLEQAKDHLLVVDDASNSDIELKIDAAESIVIDYIGATAWWREIAATWTAETVPPLVHAAILIQLGELFRYRGDDPDGPRHGPGDLSPYVANILRRYRDPVLA
jgi:hypothetical protein